MDSHELIKTFASSTAKEMKGRDFGTSSQGNGLITFQAAWYRQEKAGPSLVDLDLIRSTEHGEQTLTQQLTVAAGSDAADVIREKAYELLER